MDPNLRSKGGEEAAFVGRSRSSEPAPLESSNDCVRLYHRHETVITTYPRPGSNRFPRSPPLLPLRSPDSSPSSLSLSLPLSLSLGFSDSWLGLVGIGVILWLLISWLLLGRESDREAVWRA
ncbi:hypothetical protein BHM03_00047250 [Ensete ventricosum]|nr:hypothetical protein BHM03_00047250 [Ensete ventricosum]